MPTLDLYKNRRSSSVLIGKKSFELPNEYTVEEIERILEVRQEIESIEESEVIGNGAAQAKRHNDLVFCQLEIMFQHHQPDIRADDLKKLMSLNEALEVIGFFQKYRHIAISGIISEANTKAESKKKVAKARKELRELRRMITYMVVSGFSLLELKKLYVDEFHDYYDELVYILEERGEVKKGTYDKIRKKGGAENVESTVNSLRSMMMKGISSRK